MQVRVPAMEEHEAAGGSEVQTPVGDVVVGRVQGPEVVAEVAHLSATAQVFIKNAVSPL